MAERTLQVRIGVNAGSAESQLKALNVNIKNTKSEFDKAGAGIKDFEKTTDGAKAKISALGDQLKAQAQKVEILKKQIKEAEEVLKTSNQAYENQKQKVADLNSKLEQAKKTYGENSKEVKALSKELKEAEKSLQSKEKAVISADNKLVNLGTQLNNTESDMRKLKSEIEDTEQSLKTMSFDKVGEKLSNVGSQLTSVGDKLKGFGTKLMIGVTAPLLGVASAGVESFSNIGESLNVLESIYGEATKKLVGYNEELVNSHGLSEEAYYKSMSSFGAMLQGNTKISKEELSKLTDTLVKRSSDLTSFFNANQDKVQEDIQSILKGNYAVADNYGVLMNVGILEDYASSIGKVWKELDQEEKSLMGVQYFLEKTNIASGDFEKTNDGWANSIRRLQATLKNLSKIFGEVLLPILEPLLSKFTDFVTKLGKMDEKTKKTVVMFSVIAMIIPPIIVVLGILISSIGSIVGAFGALSTAIATAGGLGAFFTASILPVIGVILGVIGAIVLLVEAVKSNFEGIKEALGNLKTSFDENLAPMKDAFMGVWQSMQEAYTNIIQPLFMALGEFIQVVIQFIADIMPGISTAFQIVCDVLKTIWESVGAPVFEFIVEVVGMVVEWFKQYAPQIAEVFNSVMDSMKRFWDNVGKPLWDIIKVIIEGVINALRPIISSLLKTCGTVFEGIKSVWDNVLKPVWDAIVEVVGWVLEKVKPHMDTFKSCIEGAMNFVLKPIQWVIDKFETLFGWIGKVGGKVGGFLSKFNPFKSKSLDLGVSIDTSGVQEFNNMALSGQYYNSRTPRAGEVNDFISRKSNKVEDDSTKELLASMNTQNRILTKMLEALVAERTTVVDNTINLDGRAIAKGTARFMEKEISNLNKRTNRLSGLAY
ncbi:hypothetical protein [Clostridium sp.]|uniref:hypothetical protein n=1 Tax=Clostridium sp. TaxID=1506 RepID=UPI001DE7662C|nr:hypothetical protein [Clostridium sp.]MBS5985277.1 hypothetical protein [Clostridium sp.]